MELDKSNMRQVIIDSANQLKEGLDLAKDISFDGSPAGGFKNVVVFGIGGSAMPVDVLNSTVQTKIPVYIHRDYDLPEFVDKESLLIFISYSGNTEEVISSINKALSKKITSAVGISSGGKLEDLCKENNLPFVKVPSGIQPRSATGYLFSVLVKILSNSSIIDDVSDQIIETSTGLQKITSELEEEGKALAKNLLNKVPIIYSSDKYKEISRIWKIKFNENSKIPSFCNYFPELNHNEMVGFSEAKNNDKFYFIIIKDKKDHERNKKRMDLFSSLLKERGSETYFVNIKEGSEIYKVFSTLLLGDWVSYYLALKKNIDPTPVQMVEEFKELLKN